MDLTPFSEIAGVLAVAAVVAAIGLKLKQPLIISFLFAGIIAGPTGLGLIADPHQIELLASIGISLLLFVVGLRLDIGMIRTVGPVALATGLGQVVFTSIIGFLIALGFGMSPTTATYVAVALTFSSTIIIVKLLSDKNEIDSLHGRIAVGFLLVQDIMAILALIGLTAFGGDQGDQDLITTSLWILAKGLMLLAAIVVLMRYVLQRALNYLARSHELLVLFAITWAVVLASVAELLGFSKEVGAFVAGISLASMHQRDAIGARLVVLRDFLLLFFFINLGAQLDLTMLGAELGKASVFSVFVLVGNPLIVLGIMGWMGYRKRTSFMSGLAVAQISEFSLILAALGLKLGHIDASTMSMITLVGLVTIFASTYMIIYSGPIYAKLSGMLGIFERSHPFREALVTQPDADAAGPLVVLMGLGNYGSAIASRLRQYGWPLLAVDFDPKALERGREMGLPVAYGDVGDPEMLAQLPLRHARWVICAVRDRDINRALRRFLTDSGFTGRAAITAGNSAQAEEFNAWEGVLVLQPFRDAAEQAVESVVGAVQSVPGLRDWPAVLEEVILQPGSIFTGKRLGDLEIRRQHGVSVLAISRAGKVTFSPGADFVMFPGDRLMLLCPRDHAAAAVEHLRQRDLGSPADVASAFCADELVVHDNAEWVGKTLAELDFNNRFGATVIGIRRGQECHTSPRAADRIQAEDTLVVVGSTECIRSLHESVEAMNDHR